jgi:hypothetical protein
MAYQWHLNGSISTKASWRNQWRNNGISVMAIKRKSASMWQWRIENISVKQLNNRKKPISSTMAKMAYQYVGNGVNIS